MMRFESRAVTQFSACFFLVGDRLTQSSWPFNCPFMDVESSTAGFLSFFGFLIFTSGFTWLYRVSTTRE